MKKVNLILVFVLCAYLQSNAQFYLGIKAGLNFHNFGVSKEQKEYFRPSMKMGFQMGATAEIALSGRFGIQMEALYAQRGSKYSSNFELKDDQNNSVIINAKENLSYIEIPLLLKYNFRGREMGGYLLAGPQLGFAMKGKWSGTFTSSKSDTPINDVTLKFGSTRSDNYKKSSLGLAIGAGFFYELEVGKIVADVRYVLGLSNIVANPTSVSGPSIVINQNGDYIPLAPAAIAGNSDTNHITNNAVMISVGYAFPLGRGGW